jgi:hypothetical protein
MSILDSQIRSIVCDGPGCGKEVMFDLKDQKTVFENPDNVWLKSTRITQTGDGRNLVYCSDTCEVKGVATGKHNIPEAPKIITPTNPAAIIEAARAAQQAKQAEQAIRDGQPTKVQLTD